MTAAVLFQTMPPLSVEEYGNLEKSIRDHGIQVPVLVDEDGVVIDGHHRQKIAQQLSLDCPTVVRSGLTRAEKRALSISLNIDRRQLSREQRRSIIEASVKAAPELSNRQHAEMTGTHKNTVQAVRDELESTGQIAQSDTRVSADGRERPASQPERIAAEERSWSPETGFNAHPFTGEVTDAPTTVTETHSVKTVTGLDGKAYPKAEPKTPKPIVIGDAATTQNAETASKEIGSAVEVLSRFGNAAHRARILTDWWPLGKSAVPPINRDLFNPAQLRQIAESLRQLATEMENQNV